MKIQILAIPYQKFPAVSVRQMRSLPKLVWLDSCKPDATSSASRFDIIAAAPSLEINGTATDYRSQLESRLSARAVETTLPFAGGWIGYIGYEFMHSEFSIVGHEKPLWFGWYDWAIIHDHNLKCSHLIITDWCSDATKDQVLKLLASPADQALPFSCSSFSANQSRCAYIECVERIQDYISAGDAYQVNFAQRYSAKFQGDSLSAYEKLRGAVPSPYGAYLDMKSECILSVSPERFIQLDGRYAVTQPIKGTAPRSSDPAIDKAQKDNLVASIKNRAENVMIVDLLRNDFSQLCEPHSVKVPELFKVHSFENVHHLISTVEGKLIDKASHVDFIFTCFPGGSITGAPKKRAMQIINELEPNPRGPYCGSIGYFSANQKTEFNIAIRTLQVKGDDILCWGGGGIVADSNPDSEFEESEYKVKALMDTLERN